MNPTSQYCHPRTAESRPVNGSLDIGAHEFVSAFQYDVDSYTGCKDSYIHAGTPTTNYGVNQRMTICGYADQGSVDRGIVKFDLTSIPTYTTITSATLYPYAYDAAAVRGSTGCYGAYPLTGSFTENQVTWNKATSSVNWTAPGGHFNATADATAAKQGTAGVWYAFTVTSRVEGWINTPSSNYGWVVKCTDEALNNQDFVTSSNNTDVIHRPKLVIRSTP